MPKRRSVFTQKRKTHGTRLSHRQPVTPSVNPGALTYQGINQVTSVLQSLQGLLDGTFAGAPEPLRIYIENSMLSLHGLVEVLSAKLPQTTKTETEYEAPKVEGEKIAAALEELEVIAASIATKPNSAMKIAEDKLLTHGVMDALHAIALGKGATVTNYISMQGSARKACMRIAEAWQDRQERIADLNRHDREEWEDIMRSLQDDMAKAHAFINNM